MPEYMQKKKSADPLASAAEKITQNAPSGLSNSAMLDVLRGKSAPTDAMLGSKTSMGIGLQSKMESAYGTDFSSVELYRSDAVKAAGAGAVASGGKIALSPDLDLNSHHGQMVLGHELSHVVSQSRGESTGSGFLSDSSLESQADRQGELAASGRSVFETGGLSTQSAFAPMVSAGSTFGGEASLAPLSGGMSSGTGAPMQAFLGGLFDKRTDDQKDNDYVEELGRQNYYLTAFTMLSDKQLKTDFPEMGQADTHFGNKAHEEMRAMSPERRQKMFNIMGDKQKEANLTQLSMYQRFLEAAPERIQGDKNRSTYAAFMASKSAHQNIFANYSAMMAKLGIGEFDDEMTNARQRDGGYTEEQIKILDHIRDAYLLDNASKPDVLGPEAKEISENVDATWVNEAMKRKNNWRKGWTK